MIAAALLAIAVTAAGEPGADARIALLVGDDTGFELDRPLHHTGTDVDRMASVLIELGHFKPENVIRIEGATAGDVLNGLDQLAGRKASLFLFYYSGHADDEGLRVRGTRLPLATLLEHFATVTAGLRLGILDACQSGAATVSKGVIPGPAFDVQLDDRLSQGQVLISSSTSDEQSFESEELRGALFTLHLVTGLRGAADQNGDGQVTLGEAYAYAYTQTLRATLLSRGGPQHPTFRWDFGGQKDPVLTELDPSARLTLRSTDDGDYVIFNELEREVIAEIPSHPGEVEHLALARGQYVVKHRGLRDLREAQIELDPSDDRVLEESSMPVVPLVRLARKGGSDLVAFAAAGVSVSSFETAGAPLVTAGVEWQGAHWTTGVGATAGVGTQTTAGLETTDATFGVNAEELYGWRFPFGQFRLGPTLSLLLIDQASYGRSSLFSIGALLAGRGQFELPLSTNVGLFLSADVGALFTHLSSTPATFGATHGPLGIAGSVGGSLGVRIAL